ncbi:hypothetical protein DH2020_043343 [Rehmannia glutinosa]|uniref:Uncharacterized protein n=1 Tax=Rehmannia glutinosa TaxID=99300 RepID=A0ABR0UJV6_REHGL
MATGIGDYCPTIAAKLPGRTDNEIKNYCHTRLKKRSKRMSDLMNRQPDNLVQKQSSEEISVFKNCKEVSSSACSWQKLDNFQASDINILESSSGSSNSWNPGPVNCDSEDSASSSREPKRSFLSEETVPGEASGIFQDQNDERGSIAGFEGNFWSEPFLVDTHYCPDDSFAITLDEGGFFSAYLFA